MKTPISGLYDHSLEVSFTISSSTSPLTLLTAPILTPTTTFLLNKISFPNFSIPEK